LLEVVDGYLSITTVHMAMIKIPTDKHGSQIRSLCFYCLGGFSHNCMDIPDGNMTSTTSSEDERIQIAKRTFNLSSVQKG